MFLFPFLPVQTRTSKHKQPKLVATGLNNIRLILYKVTIVNSKILYFLKSDHGKQTSSGTSEQFYRIC